MNSFQDTWMEQWNTNFAFEISLSGFLAFEILIVTSQ